MKMTKEQLIDLIMHTGREIENPVHISQPYAESILDDFIKIEQDEELICPFCGSNDVQEVNGTMECLDCHEDWVINWKR